jgi:hypothetical protein
MLPGAVAVVNIMTAIRDRAQDGDSDYGNLSLAATDCEQVNEGFGSFCLKLGEMGHSSYVRESVSL